MFTAPIEDELEDVRELGKSGVAIYKKSAPDERADASQDDAELINAGQWVRWFHALSVTRCEFGLKGSPRDLTLSLPSPSSWWRHYHCILLLT